MAISLKQITGKIVMPGTFIGVQAKVTATPLTTASALTFSGDDTISWGPVVAVTSAAGQLPSSFKIPTSSDQTEVFWRFVAEPVDRLSGVPKSWTMGNFQLTGTTTADLTDLVEVDLTAIDPALVVTVQGLVTQAEESETNAAASATSAEGFADAALDSAADADTSADAADVSEANAASSATTASTAATTATTKASEAATSATSASGSATTATTQAGNASTSATAAAGSATAAAGSATAAATAKTAAEAARDAAVAVGSTNDTIIAGRVNDATSATAVALSATYAALPMVATTVTASGAAVVNKHNPVNATGGAKSLSLPTGQPEGKQISIEKTDTSTNAVSITGNIRGVAAQTLTLAWANETLLLRTDSAGSWWPVAGHKTKTAIEAAITAGAAAEVTGTSTPTRVTLDGRYAAVNLVSPIQQLLKPAAVMASPPTVTLGNGGTASTISSGVTIAPADTRLRYFGAYAHGYSSPLHTSAFNGSVTQGNIAYCHGPWGFEFDFDGDKFEIGGIVNTADIDNFRIRVDGEFVAQAMSTNHPASGTGNNYILITFASRKMRRIRIDCSTYFRFRHLIVPPTATLMPPSTPFGPRWGAFGDSFTEGADGISYFPNGPQSWTQTLGDYLGFKIRPMGVSGSGYINTGGAANYRGRAVQDLTAPTQQYGGSVPVYDGIIISGGINDFASAAGDFTTEIPLLYATIRSVQPTAKLVVVLPFNVRTSQQLTQAKVDAIRAAWVATGDVRLIVETQYDPTGAWFFGTGQTNSMTGNGNADYYRSSDGLHPSSSTNYSGGHDYIAARVAAEIRKGLTV